jgi:hypothetical protein
LRSQEADYYCIALPEPPPVGVQVGCVRCDGVYLSFGSSRADAPKGGDEDNGSSDARTYLIFHQDGGASLGRRGADGQWTAQRCRYRTLPAGLLLVHRIEPGDGNSSQDEEGEGEGEGGGSDLGPLELSAVVRDADFIRVMT